MVERKSGKIILIGSQVADKPVKKWTHYTAAKSALEGFAKSLAEEFSPSGINVNVVSPGLVSTDLTADIPEKLYPDGMPVAYDFYGDRLVISSFSQSAESTDRLNYSDVRRRIRETGYIITLSTSRKNYYNLFKCIMKPEEVTSVREILKARCPQRKQ